MTTNKINFLKAISYYKCSSDYYYLKMIKLIINSTMLKNKVILTNEWINLKYLFNAISKMSIINLLQSNYKITVTKFLLNFFSKNIINNTNNIYNDTIVLLIKKNSALFKGDFILLQSITLQASKISIIIHLNIIDISHRNYITWQKKISTYNSKNISKKIYFLITLNNVEKIIKEQKKMRTKNYFGYLKKYYQKIYIERSTKANKKYAIYRNQRNLSSSEKNLKLINVLFEKPFFTNLFPHILFDIISDKNYDNNIIQNYLNQNMQKKSTSFLKKRTISLNNILIL